MRAALASAGGELEIGVEPDVARLFFTRGAIAWIAAPRGGQKLSTLLRLRAAVPSDALRRVLVECKSSGRSFVDVLVDGHVVEREVLRRVVLEHNARQLDAIVSHATLDHVQFRPSSRAYVGGLTFSLDETLEALAEARRDPIESGPITSLTPVGMLAVTPDRVAEPRFANVRESLEQVMAIEGAIAAALVDIHSGEPLGSTAGESGFDIARGAAGQCAVVRAKLEVMRDLGIPGGIEDMLVTLGPQYHLVRPLAKHPSLFFYVVIDRATGNLGLARHKLRVLEEALRS